MACREDDLDPDNGTIIDPTAVVPDPEGTVSLSMRNSNSGKTYLDDIYILNENFAGAYFASIGAVQGLGNVSNIPITGWANQVSVIEKNGYVAYDDGIFYRIFVEQSYTNTEGGIIGFDIKYQKPFKGVDEDIILPKESVSFDWKSSSGAYLNEKIYFENHNIIVFTVESDQTWCHVSKCSSYKESFLYNGLEVSCKENETDSIRIANIKITNAHNKTTYLKIIQSPSNHTASGTGTKNNPYNVTATIKLMMEGVPTMKIYTTGIVSQIDNIDSGTATYYISDDGTSTDQLKVYRGLGLEGSAFSINGLKVGDEVIVYGRVTYNNNTIEFSQGSILFMLNGQTTTPTPTAIDVTCAQATELTNALSNGATSSETYTVTGYITEVVGSVSRNQQTFWMADTKDGGKVFEAYWANLPEGVTEFKKGMKVKITGQLTKYVNNSTGQVTPEIKNANVGILENGDDPVIPPAGTEVTCAQAAELTNTLADGATSSETYTVTGYITEVIGSVSRNQQSFWMADTKDGGKMFEAYWANLPEGVSEFQVGAKVKITGQLMKYVKDGKVTPEIKNANVVILEEGDGNNDN